MPGQQRSAGKTSHLGTNNYGTIAISEPCHTTTLIRVIKNPKSLSGIRYYTKGDDSKTRNPIERNGLSLPKRHLLGKLAYIRYLAVRDKDGQYLGTLEVTQDITEIQKLEGERRLVDERD